VRNLSREEEFIIESHEEKTKDGATCGGAKKKDTQRHLADGNQKAIEILDSFEESRPGERLYNALVK